MRTFIALTLPPDVRQPLAILQEALRKADADVSWVKPENIHLTLKFLGETDDQTARKVTGQLQQRAGSCGSFRAGLSVIGAFPSLSAPRVIWVGIGTGDERIKQLARGIEDDLAGLGFPAEARAFASHCTLGRTRSGRNRAKLAALLGSEKLTKQVPLQEFDVNRIVYFQSTLTPAGPVYTPLAEIPLVV